MPRVGRPRQPEGRSVLAGSLGRSAPPLPLEAPGTVQVPGACSVQAFALLWGFGFGTRTPMLHAMRGAFFGRKHFGTILGMSAFPMAIGMMATPVIVGRVFDTTGTYDTSLYVLAAACVVAASTILLATKPATPR